ncbi:MAG: AMP-binding protein, partial [Actinobacteria bacterium]|nr:AMP-binding protein [Actinomycetota bacterium]
MTMIEKLSDELRPERFSKLSQVVGEFCSEHAELPAFTCFGRTLDYSEVDELSDRFAHYLITQTSLKPGDRIAIQLPNILQFPIAFYGATRAGLVVVNTNPLYTDKEMAHQFKDSRVKGIVILSNFCS